MSKDLSISDINKLLHFLDFFSEPPDSLYREVNGYRCEAETMLAFRRALDETGFPIVFDWSQWIRDHEMYQNINMDIEEQIMHADLETLRKLMTSYIRGDRFNEGLFLAAATGGKIKQMLLRLQELTEGETGVSTSFR